ncbi:MAG: fatty acid synthase subunit beta domain-containing protein, partial [Rhodococcus sp. (in: high G+C Gram-positive bacteria)]
MTINESTPTDKQRSTDRAEALSERLTAGEPYAIAFGGQGAPWLPTLDELTRDCALEPQITELVNTAARILEPVAQELLVVRPLGFDPIAWMLEQELADDLTAGPSPAALSSASVSVPGVLLTQIAALRALAVQGLDYTETRPVAVIGHSQGVIAEAAVADSGRSDAEMLAVAQLIGAAAGLVGRRRGLIGSGERAPMIAVSAVDPDRLKAIVADVAGDDATTSAVVAIRNGRRRVVLSGPYTKLVRVQQRCEEISANETRERDAKKRGGAIFAPVFEPLDIEVGFHHPQMEEAVDVVTSWAERCGVDVARASALAKAILADPVDWVAATKSVVDAGAQWILDLGPGESLTRLTSSNVSGHGVGVVAASTRTGHRNLLTPGAMPTVDRPWSTFAPRVVTLPSGYTAVETSFTKLTGRSPILLAGMTPTTVDPKIVAAATNAGHWAELAGGGQVTEEIFAGHVAELEELLEPGRSVQFNSLFLDPYLWKLQLGGKRLVQKARTAGAPFDGVVVTAGIPELEEAVALIEELSEVGLSHVAFKPGTVAQIRAVIRIANEVPDYPVIVHIEGGRAGGHHSWEDLDDLLVATYAELRSHDNIVICVGGGIGTPERAADYLTGRWSEAAGYSAMPLDGILVGTAAMATLEATTSPEVKQLLVDTPGTPDWVGAGTATGGMASGRSQLGADIHEIDNSASRTGRLLDDVAGDDDAVAERRDEIIAALDSTAKPYFGDIASMTYLQWLQRYVELAVGHDIETTTPWLDVTWRVRFREMLQRAEARLHPADRGPVPTLFADTSDVLDRPAEAISNLVAAYPDAETVVLHPADIPFFISVCRMPGKPINFVPVVDKDVRRWWRSDSLWQAHDARYSADQVCVIPGTVAVAGIDRMNEPVGDLLNRFEKAAADRILAEGGDNTTVATRRHPDNAGGLVGMVLAAPDITWASRLAPNPVRRLGAVSEWDVVSDELATHARTGASLTVDGTDRVILSVPLSPGKTVDISITVPASAVDGGAPLVTASDAESAMSALLGVAAGQDLPTVKNGSARLNIAWSPDLIADHAGVTGSGLPAEYGVGHSAVPDVLVGACWPAVFAVLGAAQSVDAGAVIEGMLDLVHLDHRIDLVGTLPDHHSILVVKADVGEVLDTDLGRVVEVSVEIGAMLGEGLDAPVVATLVERFAIRGRLGTGTLSDPPRAGGSVTDALV